jgi:hypothetical protein
MAQTATRSPRLRPCICRRNHALQMEMEHADFSKGAVGRESRADDDRVSALVITAIDQQPARAAVRSHFTKSDFLLALHGAQITRHPSPPASYQSVVYRNGAKLQRVVGVEPLLSPRCFI